ncbi:MAG: HAMP domain-containing protein [Alphaproteobacteria bacterium]|nr:HAMP domain-containing protein [Alphaproteobacteria bacterium]
MLYRHDEAEGKKTEQHYAELTKLIAALDGATRGAPFRDKFDEARTLATQYDAGFKRAAQLSRELDGLFNRQTGELPKLARAITADVTFVLEGAVADEHALEKEADALISRTSTVMLVLALAGLAIGFALAWFIGGAIAKPILGMTGAMQKLAQGDKTAAIPAVGQKDEIGQMAGSVQVFKDNMIKTAEMEAEKEKQREAEIKRQGRIEQLIKDFDAEASSALKTVAGAATELESTAQSMSATAEETTRQATAVAAASEQASTNVQTVASATEELAASVQEVGRQVTQSASIAQKAVDEAAKTNERVTGLAEAAQKIGEVVNLINDIASQTNLLALNATIEAARAGEAGKGFAVVASEVKSLATQTAKATDDIAAQISAIQVATNEAVTAIKGIGATIAEINDIASAIASAVEEQGAATKEIATNVSQAAAGTQEVSSNITSVTQAAGETGTASGQVLSAASSLGKESEALRRKVDEFLAGIKAA